MSGNDQILNQYASSTTLSTRRGLYDTNVGVPLTDRLEELLQLQTAASLLDVGCGYGADIARFSSRHPHVYCCGFDQSAGQINDAKAKLPSADIFVGDAQTFELNKQFERVLVRHVLHLVPDPSAALDRILSHVSPSGHVVIAVHSAKSQPKFAAWRSWFYEQTGISYSAPSEKLTLENHAQVFMKPGWQTDFIEAQEMIHLTDPEPYLVYIKGQKRWSREPSETEITMLLEHARSEIENTITRQGFFEDPSINGIIVLRR